MLTSAQTMAHYDLNLPTIIATDASNTGLGAILFQVQKDGTRRLVTYVSRSLTDTEKNYAAIEKEALGVTWACERLDQYVRGMHFRVETDHKPLVPLMTTKDLAQIPVRILRMRLRMMRYAPSFKHVQGTHNQLADALSRAPHSQPTADDILFIEDLESAALNLFSTNHQIERIKSEQKNDEVLKEVIRCCQSGWPTYKSDANIAIQPYWDAQAHLTIARDILLYDSRIVIPHSLRLETLEQIHQAHQGITKCRARARRSVWWPRMSTQVQEMVENCKTCRLASPIPTETLCPSSLPERAWERLGTDVFEFQKKHYLIAVDYFSRWIEVRQLSSLSTKGAIDAFKSIFGVHGIADVVVSDNGPQFASAEFTEFASHYAFTHVTSSPRYPRANGEAERAVRTVKELWRKSNDPELSLLTYRATPLENGYTSSELLMGRLIRSTLPSTLDSLHPINTTRKEIEKQEMHQRLRSKNHHDKRPLIQDLPELAPQEPVHVRDLNREGAIVKQVAPRSYSVRTEKGTV